MSEVFTKFVKEGLTEKLANYVTTNNKNKATEVKKFIEEALDPPSKLARQRILGAANDLFKQNQA